MENKAPLSAAVEILTAFQDAESEDEAEMSGRALAISSTIKTLNC